ncbi:MAG: hypothetical protein AB7K86_16270 [Rhodospirillales bacterium]
MRAIGAALALAAAPASGQETVTLRWHHAGGPHAFETGAVIAPLARSLTVLSDERLKVDVTPGLPADRLLDQIARGEADIVAVTLAQHPGAFPRLEALELPFLAAAAETVSKAAWDYADGDAGPDVAPYRLLSISAADAAAVHTTTRRVERLEDLKGLRLAVTGPWGAATATALGAIPAPANQADGVVLPWLAVLPAKAWSGVHRHADAPLYHPILLVLMSRQRHDTLPAALREAIARATGPAFGAQYGGIHDASARDARTMARQLGQEVAVPLPPELARWRAAAEPVHQAWIAAADARGLDGAALYRALRAAIERAAARS